MEAAQSSCESDAHMGCYGAILWDDRRSYLRPFDAVRALADTPPRRTKFASVSLGRKLGPWAQRASMRPFFRVPKEPLWATNQPGAGIVVLLPIDQHSLRRVTPRNNYESASQWRTSDAGVLAYSSSKRAISRVRSSRTRFRSAAL